jgi:hypothetical protein
VKTESRRRRATDALIRALKWRWTALFILFVVGATLFIFLGRKQWWPPYYPEVGKAAPGKEMPDATVLISTLILVYTFFVAAYGALTPSIVGSRANQPWRLAALLLVFGTVGLDLWRVWNSTGDLYSTTMRQLHPDQVQDAVAEFARYFLVNVLVIVFALVVASWARSPEKDSSPAASPA